MASSSSAKSKSKSKSKGSSSKTLKVTIKPSYLATLEGKNLIIFEVDENDPPKNFLSVLQKMIIVCTDKDEDDFRAPTNVNEVPITTTGEGVYVIEMRGKYDQFEFNKERLLGVKGSNYLVAVKRTHDWHEVTGSEKPIEGAKSLGFNGSYTEYSQEGIRDGSMKLGFGPLMWSLTSLLGGKNSCFDFLTVCVNLFEPARYPVIGREIIQYPYEYCWLSVSFMELIYGWDTLSAYVIKCQLDPEMEFEMKCTRMTIKVYGDAGILEDMTIETVNKSNIYKLLGMAKCGASITQ